MRVAEANPKQPSMLKGTNVLLATTTVQDLDRFLDGFGTKAATTRRVA
jgi:hypothetical protein